MRGRHLRGARVRRAERRRCCISSRAGRGALPAAASLLSSCEIVAASNLASARRSSPDFGFGAGFAGLGFSSARRLLPRASSARAVSRPGRASAGVGLLGPLDRLRRRRRRRRLGDFAAAAAGLRLDRLGLPSARAAVPAALRPSAARLWRPGFVGSGRGGRLRAWAAEAATASGGGVGGAGLDRSGLSSSPGSGSALQRRRRRRHVALGFGAPAGVGFVSVTSATLSAFGCGCDLLRASSRPS